MLSKFPITADGWKSDDHGIRPEFTVVPDRVSLSAEWRLWIRTLVWFDALEHASGTVYETMGSLLWIIILYVYWPNYIVLPLANILKTKL